MMNINHLSAIVRGFADDKDTKGGPILWATRTRADDKGDRVRRADRQCDDQCSFRLEFEEVGSWKIGHENPGPVRIIGDGHIILDAIGQECQFCVGKHNLTQAASGYQYCDFHLPMDADQFKSFSGQVGTTCKANNLKSNWPESRKNEFLSNIKLLICECRKSSKVCNLSGLIVPGDLMMARSEIPTTLLVSSYFHGKLNLASAKFFGTMLNVSSSVFMEHVDLSLFEGFSEKADRVQSGQSHYRFPRMAFKNVLFKSQIDFRYRYFSTRTDFRFSRFRKPPLFQGTTICPDTEFPELSNFEPAGDERAGNSFCAIKHEVGRHRLVHEENKFWALEQMARRSTLSWSPKDWLPCMFSFAYEKLAFYGLNLTKPLVWLGLVIFLVFPYTYAVMADVSSNYAAKPFNSLGAWMKLEAASFRQVVKPFDVWSSTGSTDTLQLLYGINTCSVISDCVWTRMLFSVESIISFSLLTLFLLALRRRFKLD